MSDEGDRTCPLCAEEMDLTDQQLKPCKCGYEICVWCWHHIMDMAEKDSTEGRCPACRNPYNKDKIVGTTARCERLASEMNVEKKLKSQKGKSKTSEGRKQLGSVRVIQRNLVYVVGLPLNFADEDLLQHKEYFGQYGKVLKVSISRTTTGAIQQFSNSTCSVYITYSKEEEAVRCIQLVHGFVLDGRPLRACFGTTKYCHAWLRNVPCSNPDCLYLHEIGSQEDSFSKDEVISAYTRSRVQQITGSSNPMQRRSGKVLPPPADENCNNSSTSAKPMIKTSTTTNNSAVGAGLSPPNSSSGRSAALPAGASWGNRPSNNLLRTSDTCNVPVAFSKGVANQVSSVRSDTGKKKVPNEESTFSQDKNRTGTFESVKNESNTDGRMIVSDSKLASSHVSSLPLSKTPHSPRTPMPRPNSSNTVDSSISSGELSSEEDSIQDRDGNIENACSDILSMSIHENQHLQNGSADDIRKPLISQTSEKALNPTEEVSVSGAKSELSLGMPTQETQGDLHEVEEDDLLSFDNQRIKDPDVAAKLLPKFSHTFSSSKHSNIHTPMVNNADGLISIDSDRQLADRSGNMMFSSSDIPNAHPEHIPNGLKGNDVEYFNLFPSKEKRSLLGGAVDMGESSIISNILSMDFDPWNESLTSPQSLAKFLHEADKEPNSFGVQASWKNQNCHQSRFSFAREEEPVNQVSDFGLSTNYHDQAFKLNHFGNDFSGSNNLHFEKFVNHNGIPVSSGAEADIFSSGHSHLSSSKPSVSRSQISAPPGFSAPSRAPPPGFTSHERTDQIFEPLSGNHMFDTSTLSRNQYQTPSSGGHTFNNGDIEFMDPAILAVGKGTLPIGMNNSGLEMGSSFPPQLGHTYEDSRFQPLVQQTLLPHQNQRYTDLGESFSTLGDGHGIPSRFMGQTLSNNLSSFSQFNFPRSRDGITSNGQWDGWNEAQSANNLGMAGLLRTDRLGFNRMYGGYEDSKIKMPSSGNLYNNGMYGI